MKPIALVPLLIVCSGAAALFGARYASARALSAAVERGAESAARPGPGASAEPSSQTEEIERRFARIETQLAQLSASLDRRPAIAAAETESTAEPGVATAKTALDGAAPDAAAAGDPEAALLALLSGELDWAGREALLAELREAGRLGELVELLEERTATDPHDPELQVELGRAYIAQLSEAGSPAETGKLATLADSAFDEALALDPEHLDARREKAVSLSFWPPVLGKQVEAAQQFEILIEKQAQHPAEESHAMAYLWLGNIELQMGNKARAQEVWNNGLAQFPEHAELLAQLAGTSD